MSSRWCRQRPALRRPKRTTAPRPRPGASQPASGADRHACRGDRGARRPRRGHPGDRGRRGRQHAGVDHVHVHQHGSTDDRGPDSRTLGVGNDGDDRTVHDHHGADHDDNSADDDHRAYHDDHRADDDHGADHDDNGGAVAPAFVGPEPPTVQGYLRVIAPMPIPGMRTPKPRPRRRCAVRSRAKPRIRFSVIPPSYGHGVRPHEEAAQWSSGHHLTTSPICSSGGARCCSPASGRADGGCRGRSISTSSASPGGCSARTGPTCGSTSITPTAAPSASTRPAPPTGSSPPPRPRVSGQFRPCDIRSAVWRAGLARGRRAGSLPGLCPGRGAVVTGCGARRRRRVAPRGIGRGNAARPRRAARASHRDRWRWVTIGATGRRRAFDGGKLVGCERSPFTTSPSTSTTSTPQSRSTSTSWGWRNARTGPRTSASMVSGSMPEPSRST